MYEVQCLDLDGNTIDNFFQWDCDQHIIIELKGCDEKYLSNNPEVHFTNKSREESLICRSSVKSSNIEANTTGDVIIAEVPNILLQEPYPLLVYVYLTDADDYKAQRTILYSEIPVRKRNKPSDYLYIENVSRITAENIKSEISASTEATRQAAQTDINTANKNAKDYIDKVNKDAKASVDATIADYEDTCDTIVADTSTIKDAIQKIRDNTQYVAEKTKTTIETNMTTLMNENGLELKMVNDDGDVTMTILIPDSSE